MIRIKKNLNVSSGLKRASHPVFQDVVVLKM
jgi:hypothetical protein